VGSKLDRVTTNRTLRYAAILVLDALAAGGSLWLALDLRMNGNIPERMITGFWESLPVTVLVATCVFHVVGLYNRAWRFVSLSDLVSIIEAATLAILGAVLTLFLLDRAAWLPTSVPIIQWFILVVILGTTRVMRRLMREQVMRRLRLRGRTTPTVSRRLALIIGAPDKAEIVLRQIESSDVPAYRVVGILDDTRADVRLRVRGVRILGTVDALEFVVARLAAAGRRPECVIVADDEAKLSGPQVVSLVTQAQTLGLSVERAAARAQVTPAAAEPAKLELQPINLSDLLDRPQAVIDDDLVRRTVADRRVLVTGAGGTIGRELVRQLAAAGPSELLLLDAGEFNLYSVDLDLQENFPEVKRTPILCSIRQRGAVMAVFAEHRPELVFHAAALKHVPLVEQNACAGIQTNVLGTRNVADAAKRFNVRAMVQVSTDKAVNPVGMMGATKRLGELYCQALDLEGGDQPDSPRFMTVRFGNVLGSSGSLIPLLQRQLSRRGPLTVTHPEIRRYFMTVFEAVQLILHSTARALEGDVRRGRICVLDMGKPVRIIDIARRMIKLSGLEPDRDVRIEIVGLRPGEKLYEELFDTNEECLASSVPGVFEAEPNPLPLAQLNHAFDQLAETSLEGDAAASRNLLEELLAIQARQPARTVPAQDVVRPEPTVSIPSLIGTSPQPA
jgi:O-antigen biosynthesis protein WbqV